MAVMVTRTFTEYKVSAEKVVVNRKERTFDTEFVGECVVKALGKPSRKAIVDAFAAKGIHIAKGTEFSFEPIGYETLGMSIEKFIANSDVVSDKDSDEQFPIDCSQRSFNGERWHVVNQVPLTGGRHRMKGVCYGKRNRAG